jgi:hypothetical protein
VTGIDSVRVRVSSVPEAALAYAALFDAAPRPTGDGAEIEVAGVRVVLIPGEPEGASGVTLRGPGDAGPVAGEHGVVVSNVPGKAPPGP